MSRVGQEDGPFDLRVHLVYLIDMNVRNMKTSDAKENKQLTELSDEELKKVNGRFFGPASLLECDAAKCRELGMKTNPQTCECE